MSANTVSLNRSALAINLSNLKTVNPVAAAKAELKDLLVGAVKEPKFQRAHMSKSILVNAQA